MRFTEKDQLSTAYRICTILMQKHLKKLKKKGPKMKIKEAIKKAFDGSDFKPLEYVDIPEDEEGLKLQDIKAKLDDSGLINEQQIIYYKNAMNYLLKNDASLAESLSLAKEYGYKLINLDSGKLVTLLYCKNLQEEFEETWKEVEGLVDDIYL
jgi:hypothetical protein